MLKLHCRVNFFAECLVTEGKTHAFMSLGILCKSGNVDLTEYHVCLGRPQPQNISTSAVSLCNTAPHLSPGGGTDTVATFGYLCPPNPGRHISLPSESLSEGRLMALLSLDSSGCVYADLYLVSGQLRSCECFHCRPTHNAYAHDEVAPRH